MTHALPAPRLAAPRRGKRLAAPRRARLLAVVLMLGGWLLVGSAFAGTASAAPVTAPATAAATAVTTAPVAGLVPSAPVPDDLDTDTDPDTGVEEPVTGTEEDSDAPGLQGPNKLQGPGGTADPTSIDLELKGLTDKPSTPVVTILGLTLLSVAPAILLTCTSFTKILVVLGLTRNALGLAQTPPNQVLAGLALFLSLFVMSPVLSQVWDMGVQPYLDGTKSATVAYETGVEPLRDFMVDNTDDDELMLLTNVAHRDLPDNRDDVSMATLVPAFILTELKQAFTIGFIIFVPFMVIDIVVSGALMALGMMMMPPTTVALPFKLLLFVMVDGWGLVIKSLVSSYN